jgi:hypothetical protein
VIPAGIEDIDGSGSIEFWHRTGRPKRHGVQKQRRVEPPARSVNIVAKYLISACSAASAVRYSD